MIPELSGSIQRAIEAGDFETALPLIESFGKAVNAAFQATSDRSEQRRVIDDASSFLRDRLHLARVMRARLASESASLTQSVCYSGSQAVENTWHMDA